MFKYVLSSITTEKVARLSHTSLWIIRLCWIFCIVICFILFTLQTVDVVKQYLSKPTKTIITTGGTDFEFPSLHICSEVPISLSATVLTRVGVGNDAITPFSDKITHIKKLLDAHPTNSVNRMNFVSRIMAETIDYKLYSTLSHRLAQFVVDVEINEETYKYTLFQTLHHHRYGNCFTLAPSKKDIHLLTDRLTITLYGDFSTVEGTSLYTVYGLPLSGFQLVGGYKANHPAGMLMFVTEQGAYPDEWSEVIALSAGFSTDVRLKMEKSLRYSEKPEKPCQKHVNNISVVDEYRRTPRQYRHTDAICYIVKIRTAYFEKCGCVTKGYFNPSSITDDIPMCFNVSRVITGEDKWENYQKRVDCVRHFEATELQSLSAKLIDECKDTRACTSVRYTIESSMRRWPLSTFLQTALIPSLGFRYYEREGLNVSLIGWKLLLEAVPKMSKLEALQLAQENFLQVVVRRGEERSKLVEEVLSYTETNLIAELGGSLGLFLGMSLLTICEIIEPFFRLIHYCSLARHVVDISDTSYIA